MATCTAKPEHEATYQELCALVRRHAGKMTALEVLAVAANMVGKLAAMQDQRTCSPAQALEVIARNVELGNAQVVEQLQNTKGTS